MVATFDIYLCMINRCLDDVDDEVRDRAAMYLRLFGEPALATTYVKEGDAFLGRRIDSAVGTDTFVQNPFTPSRH